MCPPPSAYAFFLSFFLSFFLAFFLSFFSSFLEIQLNTSDGSTEVYDQTRSTWSSIPVWSRRRYYVRASTKTNVESELRIAENAVSYTDMPSPPATKLHHCDMIRFDMITRNTI